MGTSAPLLAPSELDIIEVVHIIERAKTDLALIEGFVHGRHQRSLHVIKIDLDEACFSISCDFDLVPLIIPRDTFFIFSERLSRRSINDHDLTTVWVRFCSEVDIIEVSGILVIKKHTTVSMVSCVFRATNSKGENKVTDFDSFDECDVMGASDLRFVSVRSRFDTKDMIGIDFSMDPTLWV